MVCAKPSPSQAYLMSILDYDATTGVLSWKHRKAAAVATNRRWAGREALNSLNQRGYRHGMIDGHNVMAHRIIWKLVTGEDPETIDHINGDRADNRFTNLRSVSATENMQNWPLPASNRSGVIGVYWGTRERRWIARIKLNRVTKHLGTFVHFEDAVRARRAAELDLNFHPNHGRRRAR